MSEFLEVCAKTGVTLKMAKFCFCQREVDFVGYHLDWDTYKPTEERLTAIKDFKMPEKPAITNVCSWFGFVNQLAPFLATAPLMSSFGDLLKKSASKVVYWDKCLQKRFTQAKETICQLAKQGLAYYDINLTHHRHHGLVQGRHRVRGDAGVLLMPNSHRSTLLQGRLAFGAVWQPTPHPG